MRTSWKLSKLDKEVEHNFIEIGPLVFEKGSIIAVEKIYTARMFAPKNNQWLLVFTYQSGEKIGVFCDSYTAKVQEKRVQELILETKSRIPWKDRIFRALFRRFMSPEKWF